MKFGDSQPHSTEHFTKRNHHIMSNTDRKAELICTAPSWVQQDKSVVVKNLLDIGFRKNCSAQLVQVVHFGDYIKGSTTSKGLITSIQIRLFGAEGLPLAGALEKFVDAYVCVSFRGDDGSVVTDGFHTEATRSFRTRWTTFVMREIKGLGPRGCCPVCLEENTSHMFPIHALSCGHGLCTKCFVTIGDHQQHKCPSCREPMVPLISQIPSERMHELLIHLHRTNETQWVQCLKIRDKRWRQVLLCSPAINTEEIFKCATYLTEKKQNLTYIASHYLVRLNRVMKLLGDNEWYSELDIPKNCRTYEAIEKKLRARSDIKLEECVLGLYDITGYHMTDDRYNSLAFQLAHYICIDETEALSMRKRQKIARTT